MKLIEWRPEGWVKRSPETEQAISELLGSLVEKSVHIDWKKYCWSMDGTYSLGQVILERNEMDGYVSGWGVFIPNYERMRAMIKEAADKKRRNDIAKARRTLKKYGV